jgi:2-methylcitrate dehydratase
VPARIEFTLEDGTIDEVEKADFEGHPNNSMSWEQVEATFEDMTRDHFRTGRRNDTVSTVREIEVHRVADLTPLFT